MFKKIIFSIIVISLILSFSTLTLAQGANSEENKKSEIKMFTEALNEYELENYALAEEGFKSLLEKENLEEGIQFGALYYSSMTAINRNQTVKAEKYLERLNNFGYQSAQLNWKIAQLYLNKNNQFDNADFKKALNYLQKAKEAGISKLEFKRDLAYANLETQNLEEAKKIYEEIIKNDPSDVDYLNLAKIKEREGDINQAIKYYESALEMNSSQSSLFLNLANLYQKVDNYNAAISIYNQGIKVNKNFAPYYIGLGESHIKAENYSSAESALKRAVEINNNSYYGYYLLANLENKKGNLNEALNYYSQALKHNPDYVDAYLAEGKIHLERNENYRAISRFSLAVEKNPDYAESHYYLGRAYYQAEMLEAARSELRKALHIDDSFKQARDLLDRIEQELDLS